MQQTPWARGSRGGRAPPGPSRTAWAPGRPEDEDGPGLWRLAPHLRRLHQFLGSWYILAAASGEKDFAVERAVRSVEGVLVSLTPQNHLRVLSSRHRWVRPAGPRWAPEPLVPSALGMASGVCVPGLPGGPG